MPRPLASTSPVLLVLAVAACAPPAAESAAEQVEDAYTISPGAGSAKLTVSMPAGAGPATIL